MSIWDYIISYGSVFSPIMPLVFARKWKNKYLVSITLFVIVSFSADLISLTILYGKVNYSFLILYGLLESLILFWFFHCVLDNGKKWLVYLGIIFSLFYIYDSIWIEPNQFNTIGRSVESLIMIVLSLALFYQFFRKEDDIFLEKSPLFWINIGILIYFSGALFSFVMSSIILSTKLSWIFHNISNILKNIFIAIGLWRAKVN